MFFNRCPAFHIVKRGYSSPGCRRYFRDSTPSTTNSAFAWTASRSAASVSERSRQKTYRQWRSRNMQFVNTVDVEGKVGRLSLQRCRREQSIQGLPCRVDVTGRYRRHGQSGRDVSGVSGKYATRIYNQPFAPITKPFNYVLEQGVLDSSHQTLCRRSDFETSKFRLERKAPLSCTHSGNSARSRSGLWELRPALQPAPAWPGRARHNSTP